MPCSIPRPEHPRPDRKRDAFQNLNGAWQFAFDDQNVGVKEQWFLPEHSLDGQITVPFVFQSKASGIADECIHPWMWYRRTFTVPSEHRDERTFLCFGAVDYRCEVYVNGRIAGWHTGGYTPFRIDISAHLQDGLNDLCVHVEDQPDRTQPRGKQYWKEGLMGCWYTPCSGIWQTVWLEWVKGIELSQIHITPDLNRHQALFEIALDQMRAEPVTVDITIRWRGALVRRVRTETRDRQIRVAADLLCEDGGLEPLHPWSPASPELYDVRVELFADGAPQDAVETYFGLRTIERIHGKAYLNGHRIYQRLVLDQGYWPDTLLTPPSDEAIQEDIRLTLALGYNGARKHQKIEDPRYYYWADRMGLLVWGEVPSCYDYADQSVHNLTDTLLGFIDRDFNHPCLIAWVPLNESWGVPRIRTDPRQQACARMLYQLAKAADGTRLVSSNDGWEQVAADICGLHDYSADYETIAKHFETREAVEANGCDLRPCYVAGETPPEDAVFMVTEYGGIAFDDVRKQIGSMETWGYHGKVRDEEAFFERYASVTKAIQQLPYCEGYCYTQLTDVMQEINGLLTPDRHAKIEVERFCKLNQNPVGK